MNEEWLSSQISELVLLYTRTKGFVLNAEEIDPESRSNISVFKEQRDALDHLVRAAAKYQDGSNSGVDYDYLKDQFSKAKGHIFRAAYDALDGLVISLKLRIHSCVQNASHEAIGAAFPEYWDHYSRVEAIEKEVASHRQRKDVGNHHTLDNLDAYAASVSELNKISSQCIARTKAILLYDAKRNDELRKSKSNERRKTVLDVILKIIIPIVTGLLGLWLGISKK